MPWKRTEIVNERRLFIAAVEADQRGNFSRLCARFGISRTQGYKWVKRYETDGPEGLNDRPPVALRCPHRTADEMTSKLLEKRKECPNDGPKKIRTRLIDEGVEGVPAASTIGDMFERFGLIRPRKFRIRTPPSSEPLAHAVLPNDVWCTDFKGHFECGNQRCNPLTITDAASRFLIKCESLVEPKEGPVREQFERAFREFGIPARIRSDNGAPFASKAIGGLSRLSIWWIQLGIVPERIEPGKPQQNGRHERFHRTLKDHTACPPENSLLKQQLSFDRFRADYNFKRPHEALGMKPPASVYEPSRRAMPESLREPVYPDDMRVRRLSSGGALKVWGARLNLTKLLASQPIGLKRTDEDCYEVYYGVLLIGRIVKKDGQVVLSPLVERPAKC